MKARSIAVIGAGLAGLVVAHRLSRRGADVRIYEASDRPGGVIKTVSEGGFRVDLGPNTLVSRGDALPRLIAELGLDERVLRAPDSAARRYVAHGGTPVALPSSPLQALKTPLLSYRGKLRMLREPLAARGRENETVAAFFRRRVGGEILDAFVDPFVSGIYAGDPERLAIRHTFPRLYDLEQEYGSLTAGLVRTSRRGTPRDRRPFSFLGGMEEVVLALTEKLSDRLVTGRPLLDAAVGADAGFELTMDAPGGLERLTTDHLVLAIPAPQLATLSLFTSDEQASLANAPAAPVAVLGLGFRREDVGHPLDGFGVLVPRREPFRMLGALFSSTLFPGRAPEGHVLLTCFLGGRRRPEDALLPVEAQLGLLLPELRRLLDVRAEPVVAVRHAWRPGIPQYERDHDRTLAALSRAEARTGAIIAGNVRGGVSVPDVVASAEHAADRVSERLRL